MFYIYHNRINLSKIYELINKYRKKYKLILFDALQEESIELLNKNIIFYKLNKKDYYTKLIDELIYINNKDKLF